MAMSSLTFREKGALLLKDFVVEVSESLKHALLGFLQVFVKFPSIARIKIFTHLDLLSY
jgi:hypothetical protein